MEKLSFGWRKSTVEWKSFYMMMINHTTFCKLALRPSSDEQPTRLGPLERAILNHGTNGPNLVAHLITEAEPASET
jgi:hypothetical protein